MAKKPTTKKRASKKVAKKRATKRVAVGTKGIRPGPIGREADRKAVQLTFLKAYAQRGTILRACEVANVSRQTHYDWLELDEDYAIAFDIAHEKATDLLEDAARQRSIEGVEKEVGWYKGIAGGTERVYSDGLLKFLLEGRRSNVFKQRHELTGAGGGPIAITEIKRVVVDPTEDEE